MKPKYLKISDIMHCLRKKMYDDAEESASEHYRSRTDLPFDNEMVSNHIDPILFVIKRELEIELSRKTDNHLSLQELELYFNGTENEYLLAAFDNIEEKIIDYCNDGNSFEAKLKKLEREHEELKAENSEIRRQLELKNKVNFLFPTKTLVAMAKAQNHFWINKVETEPPILRKLIVNFIVEELGLSLDKNGENRKVQEWVKAISPDIDTEKT